MKILPKALLLIFIFQSFIFAENKFIEKKNAGYISTDFTRMRSSPEINNHNIIGSLRKGMKIYIYGYINDKVKIEKYEDFWYKIATNNLEGWVLGSFINNGDFDFESYLKSMKRPLYTVNFKKLIKSKWSDCHPNEERGCIGLIIGDNFIQWKEDSGVLIYYINSISEDENKIKLNCEIILASDPIKSTKFHTNIYIELSNNNTIFFRGIKFLKEINSEYEFMPDGFFE